MSKSSREFRTQSFKPLPDAVPPYAPAGGPWDALKNVKFD